MRWFFLTASGTYYVLADDDYIVQNCFKSNTLLPVKFWQVANTGGIRKTPPAGFSEREIVWLNPAQVVLALEREAEL
jgi:hypothetical protein